MGTGVGITDTMSATPLPWLDDTSVAVLAELVRVLSERHPEVEALILYGSSARGEQRPLDGPHPSDLDVLAIISHDLNLDSSGELALIATIGDVDVRMRPIRPLTVIPIPWTLAEWDPDFIEHVARDGILLFARGPRPPVFADIERPGKLTKNGG